LANGRIEDCQGGLGATGRSVPSAGKAGTSPAEEEKYTYSDTKESNLKNNLVDLIGIDVVEEYHKKVTV
nr:hypothetical protein [Tanacetum cinerariifolium]